MDWKKAESKSFFIFGDVQLRHDLTSLMKRNWIPELLVVILLDTLKGQENLSFMILAKSFSETINARFLEDVDFVEGDTVRNIVFEEENIIIPPDVIGIESIPTSDITYDAILNNVDGEPPREQTLTPQEVVPLRRSTRERRSALPNDYIAYLQEHESSTSPEWIDVGKDEFEHIVMEDDPVNFHQAMKSANSQQWLKAMN